LLARSVTRFVAPVAASIAALFEHVYPAVLLTD
jgi:hypothetical protein